MTRIALLGCGRIGQMHAVNLMAHPQATLASVFDINTDAAQEVAKIHGVTAVSSAQDIFSDKDVDGVLVATATATHVTYIEMAVAAGKPILCEKPIDLSLKRVNQCAQIIAGTSVPIQLGFNRRFDPGHVAVREAAHAGEIGQVHQVIITSRDPGLPSKDYLQDAGGLLRDMTIHDFDLARFMLDEEPEQVFAVASALIDPALGAAINEVDTAMIIMQTASGKQCHINNSRAAVYGYDQRVEIMGSKGMLLSDNRKSHEARRYTAHTTEAASPYLFFFIERYQEAYMAELSAFVECVQGRAPVSVGFEDGRKALVLAEAAYLSLAEKRYVSVREISA